jgi:acyl-CoA hydrolase
MTAIVAHTSERSIGVAISIGRGTGAPVVCATMTFVAVDDDGRVVAVPQFIPETPAEITRFREGAIRREFRKKLSEGSLAPLAEPANDTEDAALLVREWLKTLPRLRLPWDREAVRPRARGVSYIHKIEPIRIGKLNFHGTLYGGTLMRWLESAASLSARAYLSGRAVRLVNLDGLTFIRPAPRDVFVHIRSVVVHTDASSVTVLVSVRAEDPVAAANVEVLRAFLSYAPLDDTRIAPIECTGDEETALFNEVAHRRTLQRALAASRSQTARSA